MDLIAALEDIVPQLSLVWNRLPEDEALRVDVLGRKGRIARIMSQLPRLEPAARVVSGAGGKSRRGWLRANSLSPQARKPCAR